jgi:hypothetical protein
VPSAAVLSREPTENRLSKNRKRANLCRVEMIIQMRFQSKKIEQSRRWKPKSKP